MHDDLKSFSQKPTQKFCEKPNNFEKPQIFNKTPKVSSKTWNAWWMNEIETYQKQKMLFKAKEHLGWGLECERGLGRWEDKNNRKRSRRNEEKLCGPYI